MDAARYNPITNCHQIVTNNQSLSTTNDSFQFPKSQPSREFIINFIKDMINDIQSGNSSNLIKDAMNNDPVALHILSLKLANSVSY